MKILFFGPYSGVVTGQSEMFKLAYDNYSGHKILVDSAKYDLRALNVLYSFHKVFWFFFNERVDKIYFTCSRSFFGSLKDLPILLLSKFTSTYVVSHIHGNDFKFFIENLRFLKPVYLSLYKSINLHVVLSTKMKESLSCLGKEVNVKIVKNSYPEYLEKVDVNLKKKELALLYLSNIMASKGIFYFLDSLESILKNNRHVKAFLTGKMLPDYLMSENKVRELFFKRYNKLSEEFPERIKYYGVVDEENKKELMRSSSILVLPTFYKTEALPISILEAMRMGNAIIATNHNFLYELVDDRYGKLINPKSVHDIVSAVEFYIQNESELKKAQEKAIIRAKKDFSSKRYIFSINEVLHING